MSAPRPPTSRRVSAIVAALLASAGWPAAAGAAHPLATDDTATLGTGHLQVELTGQLARDREPEGGQVLVETSVEAVLVGTLGLHPALDAALALPVTGTRAELGGRRQGSAAGVGDLGLAVKWRFLEAGAVSLALEPGLTLPTGSETRGLGTGRPCASAFLIASLAAGPVALHLDAGYGLDRYGLAEERLEHERDVWLASVAAQGDLRPGLTVVGELGVTTSRVRASQAPGLFALAGVILAVDPQVDLDLGVKAGRAGDEATLAVLLGLTTRL